MDRINNIQIGKCLICGNEFSFHKSRTNAKCCSRQCQHDWLKMHPAWNKGITNSVKSMFRKLQGNPDPRRLNTLLSYMVTELDNYVVSRKEQRLSVEDKEANKTLKNIERANDIPNYSTPILECDIVRYPLKSGVC